MRRELDYDEFLELPAGGQEARGKTWRCPNCGRINSLKKATKYTRCLGCRFLCKVHKTFLSSVKPRGWQIFLR